MKRILFPGRFQWMFVSATHTTTKPFKQSIGLLFLTKTKSLILASLLVGALVPLLSAPARAASSPQDPGGQPADTFSILLSGKYKPVPIKPAANCNNLGLSQVNLCDGTYSRTKIYPISGLPVEDNEEGTAIGNFYVQFNGNNAVYDLPGGSLLMVFTANNLVPVSDGQGGSGMYFVGTLDLDITEATGIYTSFVGGHNKMVDILHQLADGTFVEHCICIISRPAQPAARLNVTPSEG